jgi:hypothetical protein
MKAKFGARRRLKLIRDIVSAQKDLISLAREYRLSPDDLAGWISDRTNHRALAGLCVLADLQTQILLSRYRLLAAGRLIRLATEDGEGDIARKACVDLLKMNLDRRDYEEGLAKDRVEAVSDYDARGEEESLRRLLYRDLPEELISDGGDVTDSGAEAVRGGGRSCPSRTA